MPSTYGQPPVTADTAAQKDTAGICGHQANQPWSNKQIPSWMTHALLEIVSF
jgi:hypothetical protein